MRFLCRLVLALTLIFCAAAGAQAQEAGFRIRPGDVLQITVWKEEGMDQEVLVLPDGTLTFPLVGTIKVDGMTPLAIQETMREQLDLTIPDATVTVSVRSPLGHKASVLGQVQKPGDIILTSSTGVMQALSQAGGLTPYANEDKIVVIRKTKDGKKQSITFPYDDVIKGRNIDTDIDLEPGDVVLVPTGGLF